MSGWTTEQVLALAPDASSASAGRELSSPAKWVSAGANEGSVWGEAKGSGTRPYQTAIDLGEPAFQCSCPSRKFPCKHALGLFIRYAQGEIRASEPPDWVTKWLDSRSQREAKRAEKKEAKPEADPEAAAKRSEKRWDRILSGLEECEAFLKDVAGQGLLATQSARSWDQMAARMVDAQAPGVARKLKSIGAKVGVGADWASTVAGEMGSVTLLIEAARRLDRLPEALQSDVQSALGIPLRKESIGGERILDVWDVLGQSTEIEDRITVCRSWLRARGAGRYGMHLAFSVAGQPFDVRLAPGSAFAAEVEYFPSAWPMRIHIHDREPVPFEPRGGADWAAAETALANVLAASPWTELAPVCLRNAVLGVENGQWFAIDEQGRGIAIRGGAPWALLAAGGNMPGAFFGEWDGERIRLLSAWGSWGFLPL